MPFETLLFALLVLGAVLLLMQGIDRFKRFRRRLTIMQHRIDELVTLARANDIAVRDLDGRIADVQERLDGDGG